MTMSYLMEPVLTENAKLIMAKRYLKKNEQGEPIETPKDMLWRVAKTIADVEDSERIEWAHIFYEMMAKGDFYPNSPTLMNAGRDLGQLSACFVLPVADALHNPTGDGIYDTLTNMALIHQSGGGTGFSFSRLRPRGSFVKSTAGVASGPVSFMTLYDASTEVVKQGGTRRGANMGVLRVDHPDIMEFIQCKQDTTKITNFNISVAVTDDFMEALHNGDTYALIDPKTGKEVGWYLAQDVWDAIIKNAHATGEPGVLFIDEANRYNPVPHLGKYEATNPCGEQWLLPYDVCNLGSINLGNFVTHNVVDWDRLKVTVRRAVRFLDNVIDANTYPLPEIEKLSKGIRRIGLGVMGWADMLVKLGIPYGSDESLELAEEIADFVDTTAWDYSEALATEKGAFPEWINVPDTVKYSLLRGKRLVRNSNITTVAPTGTISIFAGCSSGIEPLFALAFFRYQADERMVDYNEAYRNKLRGVLFSEEDVEMALERTADSGHIPADILKGNELGFARFVTAHDVTPEQHIRMQAAFQRYTDSSISKTVNFPREATVEDVRKIYEMAHALGCKGVTVYRDGSRDGQILSTGKTEQKKDDGPEYPDGEWAEGWEERATPLQRPEILDGRTKEIQTPLGKAYVTLNSHDEKPFEVFITLGKAGSSANADAEAIGRLISLSLRSGVALDEVVKTMRGISSDGAVGFGPNKVLSVPDGVAQALAILNGNTDKAVGVLHKVQQKTHMKPCPECGSPLAFEEGCVKCHACAYSECA